MTSLKVNCDLFRSSNAVNRVNLGDTYTLLLHLFERGQIFTIPASSSYILTCERTDNVAFTQQTGITADMETGIVTVVLDVRAISSAGLMHCNLIITNTTFGSVSTFSFSLTVIDVVLSDQTTANQYRDGMITALVNSTKAPYVDPTTGMWMEYNNTTGLFENKNYKAAGRAVVSIEKTLTEGLVDTYTTTYSYGDSSTHTVTNGAKGDTGKTSYQYATDGGYTGSETDFATKLASEATKLEIGDITDDITTGGVAKVASAEVMKNFNRQTMLKSNDIKGTKQTMTVDTNYAVQRILHTDTSTLATVRDDVFTYNENVVIEVRTLATGETLTLIHNLDTFETTIA